MRVLRPRGRDAAHAHHRSRQRRAQQRAPAQHRNPHDVRRAYQAGRSGRRRSTRALSGTDADNGYPALGPHLGSAKLRPDRADLPAQFGGGCLVPGSRTRNRPAGCGGEHMNIRTERRGLGRGLGELFQRTDTQPMPAPPNGDSQGESQAEPLAPVPQGSYFTELPLEYISPNPRQPRTVFDEDAMNELVESIREVGLLQPIVVRPLGGARFELVMGERRWRAAQLANLDMIPAIVRETADHALLRDALLENLHRVQLNPLEEAAAYQQMLEDFGCTQEELANRIKRSRPQISNTIRLLKLPPTVQRRVAAGVLSAGHAKAR